MSLTHDNIFKKQIKNNNIFFLNTCTVNKYEIKIYSSSNLYVISKQ